MASVFPETGRDADELRGVLAEWQTGDIDWRSGRAFSLVYNADDPTLEALQHDVADRFLHENALNPFVYPSLRRMEQEVVAVAAELLGTDPEAGTMSSGGTESIFLAVYTAREHARERGVERPTIVLAGTAHPAFTKAAHYLGVEEIRVPIADDLRADVGAMADAVDENTALIVGSAPNYPYGVIDPIADLAQVALDNDTLCHVDACLGGWLLPFWEEIGEPVPPWNFAVEGVTSISADIHKYGYCFKGASVIVYRDVAMKRRQHFIFDGWPGGLYGSATSAGTRPAAPIAAAWATIQHLGHDGYLAKARTVREATRRFLAGVRAIDELEISGEPDMSLFEFSSRAGPDATGAIGDVMDDRGWGLDRQQGGLHLMVSPGHLRIVDEFVADLGDAVANHGESRGVAASYGGIAANDDAEQRPGVLFLCVHNAGRSQMAAGWLRHLAGERVDVFSGGSDPADQTNAAAVAAMAEVGIDIAGQHPKPWTDEVVRAVDVVVSMGCGDVCPVYPGKRYEDWELDDPAGQPVDFVREVRDDIRSRVQALIETLELAPGAAT